MIEFADLVVVVWLMVCADVGARIIARVVAHVRDRNVRRDMTGPAS